MQRFKTAGWIVAFVLAGAVTAPAAFVTSNAVQKATVKSIVDKPVDDQYVVLRGFIAEKLADDTYTFKDASGSIRVRIPDSHFPAKPIKPDTKVELAGKVETDFLVSPEIQVTRLKILSKDELEAEENK
jgi:uncharacterized protein (TIGR00156 family)